MNRHKERWTVVPGRTREEMAAADAAEFTTLGHEAMRVQLALERDMALERDRLRVAALKARAGYPK